MANHEYNLENKNNITYLEQNIFGKHFLKKQYAEIEYWKMKIEMISNVKNKEIHKLNEHMIKKVCSILVKYYLLLDVYKLTARS